MTNEEINEMMALDIKELLLKYDLFHGTKLYFNNKCISDAGDEIVVRENVKVEECQDWCNPSMISMSYEGVNSLYLVVNGYAEALEDRKKANTVTSQLIRLSEKYNRYFELGNNTTLYFVSEEDRGITSEQYYYGEESLQ